MNKEIETMAIMVGERSPFLAEYEKSKNQDGVIFGATDFDQGYTHMIFYEDVNEAELYAFLHHKVRVRVIQNADNFVLLLFKFGPNHLIQEISFDPTLYDDARALQMVKKNNLVTIYCIERKTNVVLGIRSANLPLKMIQLCRVSWSKAFLTPDYSQGYANWYRELQKKYDTKQLWKMGVDVGYLGESYNLDEVTYTYQKEE